MKPLFEELAELDYNSVVQSICLKELQNNRKMWENELRSVGIEAPQDSAHPHKSEPVGRRATATQSVTRVCGSAVCGSAYAREQVRDHAWHDVMT